jgi:hypothetical protein
MNKVVELLAKQPIHDGKFDLSPVAAALGKANTRILGLTAAASSAGRMLNVRIFVENPAGALDALATLNITTKRTEALSFKVANREHALTQVTAGLGPANAKILAMTAAASSAGKMLNVLMQVSNPASAIEALGAKVVF